MMERRQNDWKTVLLAVGAVGGALLAFSSAALVVAFGIVGTFQPELANTKQSALDVAVMASALVVIGAAFLPAAYYSIQHLRGQAVPAGRPRLLQVWQGILLVLVWLAAALGAQFLLGNPIAKWVTPALYVLAIVVPVVFFTQLATSGLSPGSRERVWGALAAGIGLGITPAVIAELLLALVGLVGLGIYVGLHPELLSTVQRLANQLENATNLEEVLNLAGPWLSSPVALILALLFFSGFSPIIEETAKSLATWAVFDRLTSPAQGFAIGALSGAAFGLVESLLVSATPDTGWTATLLVRGASTMMHIMAASLTGWGIGSLRTRKSFGGLIGMYLLAISLHGIWNASVVAITFGSVRSALASSGPDPIGVVLMFTGAAVLLALCLAIPLAMTGMNWRFRTLAVPVTTAPREVWNNVPVADESPADAKTRSESESRPSPPAPPP